MVPKIVAVKHKVEELNEGETNLCGEDVVFRVIDGMFEGMLFTYIGDEELETTGKVTIWIDREPEDKKEEAIAFVKDVLDGLIEMAMESEDANGENHTA